MSASDFRHSDGMLSPKSLSLPYLIICFFSSSSEITDGLGVPRTLIANTNGMTLVYQLQPMTSSLVGPTEIHQPMLLDRSSRTTETSRYAGKLKVPEIGKDKINK